MMPAAELAIHNSSWLHLADDSIDDESKLKREYRYMFMWPVASVMGLCLNNRHHGVDFGKIVSICRSRAEMPTTSQTAILLASQDGPQWPV